MVNPLISDGAGLIGLIVYVFFLVVIVVVVMRILYGVIWRGVRRGMREYHHENPTLPPTV